MSLGRYARNNGLSYEEYLKLKADISSQAEEILERINASCKPGTGMYHDTREILDDKSPYRPFIIAELKVAGVEFIENGALWRY